MSALFGIAAGSIVGVALLIAGAVLLISRKKS